jgi:hypothetical protein
MQTTILIDDNEAALLLRMLPARLVRLARRGQIPCIKLPDGEVRFDPAELSAWIDQFRQPANVGEERVRGMGGPK